MTTTFSFVRERLLAAGRKGTTQADLYRALREADIPRRKKSRKGSYGGFSKTFHILVQLGWIVRTGKTEPSFTKGPNLGDILADRVFYRITPLGRSVPELSWQNPFTVLHPQYADQEYRRSKSYYVPTGRRVGRPEKPRRLRVARLPPEKPRVQRRRLRIPTSQILSNRAAELLPRIDALRSAPDVAEVEALEKALLRLFDQAVDTLESATGEEKERLGILRDRLESASVGFADMQAGVETGNRVTYLRGWERVRGCCTGE